VGFVEGAAFGGDAFGVECDVERRAMGCDTGPKGMGCHVGTSAGATSEQVMHLDVWVLALPFCKRQRIG
jgi:hypothetical protein